MLALVIAATVAGIATTATLILARPILARHVLDVPNVRSSHSSVVPRGAGVGVFAGIAAGILAGSGGLALELQSYVFVGAVLLLTALGLAEDVRGLPIRLRLTGQLIVCSISVVVIAGSYSFNFASTMGIALAVGGVFVGVYYVNAANFVDGINGISGTHGLVVGVYFTSLGRQVGAPELEICAIATAAAFTAFLPWNFPHAKLFLGDAGSYLLGGAVWLLSIYAVNIGVKPVAAAAPLCIYTIDVAITLLRRIIRRADLFAAHREHTYQRIQQISGSHTVATFTSAAATVICAMAGLLVQMGLDPRLGVTIILGVGVIYLFMPTILRTGSINPRAST